MNKENIIVMPAGIEMDRLVAEEIMVWPYIDKAISYDVSMGIRWTYQEDGVWKFQPGVAWRWSPSTDITAAWDVVEKFIEIYFERQGSEYFVMIGDDFDTAVTTTSMPLSICRAALLATIK